jgi:hypothetical protein
MKRVYVLFSVKRVVKGKPNVKFVFRCYVASYCFEVSMLFPKNPANKNYGQS